MFTGIIEATGTLAQVTDTGGDRRMVIVSVSGVLGAVRLGDSIAVNGVCLTVAELVERGFAADLSAETLSVTTAGGWKKGARVNLELALTPNKPLGGHMVQGHVDGVGQLLEKHEDARSWRYTFDASQALARYIARKGSIAIDGVSLTVNEVRDGVSGARFGVNIIPHTLAATTLGALNPGGSVNLEVDLIARYLERLLAAREEGP